MFGSSVPATSALIVLKNVLWKLTGWPSKVSGALPRTKSRMAVA